MPEADVAILLAAGQGKRFGADKTRLVLLGETLVQRHVRQLRGSVRRSIIVTNAQNAASIRADFAGRDGAAPEIVLQQGDTAEDGVLTGLRAAMQACSLFIVCVNDLVHDRAYAAMQSMADGITIMAAQSTQVFPGGRIDFGMNGAVAAIREKPDGGCQPSEWINVFIHRYDGRDAVDALYTGLCAGKGYEAVLTQLIASGMACRALRLDAWHAVKTPEDWQAARALFSVA